jgi:hypothetical protein
MPAQIDQQQLAQQLVDRARAEGVELLGPGGLLTGLTKTVLETALEAEMSEHLGYDKHDPQGRNGGNSRNGVRSKTVLTAIGPVPVEVPRDRDGSFEPQLVHKRQRRLDGIDQVVLSLSARGLTTGEIAAHFAEVYGATVSKDTISRITDTVVEEMTEWRTRPLDRGAVSTDRCELGSCAGRQQACHDFLWGAVAEHDSGSLVEFAGHRAQVARGVHGQIGVLAEVLPEQAIGVLVGRPLPGRVRVAEEDRQAERGLDLLV